jgi:glycosyltransferase involved in cell wall biosynthesis
MSQHVKLRIAIVSAFYSEGMGYSENCLSKALASLGHEVHVVTSTFNVYGNEPEYDKTYREFLGPRQLAPGTTSVDGYHVHRLKSGLVAGFYVTIDGLVKKIAELEPDIVHTLEIASLQTFALAAKRPFAKYKLFSETHQCLSVVRPFMLQPRGALLKKSIYRATRTVPTALASCAVETCYAVTRDCAEVANRFYGVPHTKIRMKPLGTDTDQFHPPETLEEVTARRQLRQGLGYGDDDIVCLYTGRFSNVKNPLVLAQAIDSLSQTDPRYKGLFVGNGVQKDAIAACRNTRILPFMTHRSLAEHYRAVDIAVWPCQESMSMLDAAASGLPVVGSHRIGEPDRVNGNGKMYEENSLESMVDVLQSLSSQSERRLYGDAGRRKMLQDFSWIGYAQGVEADFLASVARH